MKLKIILLISLLSLLFLGFLRPQNTCDITLSNAKSNKSFKICDKLTNDKIQAVLGKAISMEKQVQENGEDPVFVIVYDGLTLENQNGLIKFIDITSAKWKLNNYTIGSPIEMVEAKFEKSTKMYLSDCKFKLKDGKGILFADVDTNKKIKRIGVFY